MDEQSIIKSIESGDLNIIQVAERMKMLLDTCKYTQEQLSQKLNKSRSAVANTLRLINLSPEVKAKIESGALTAGHARALVTLPPAEQNVLMQEIIDNKLSVREIEKRVQVYAHESSQVVDLTEQQAYELMTQELRAIVEQMKDTLKVKVRLVGTNKQGRIYIDYTSHDDLERIKYVLSLTE